MDSLKTMPAGYPDHLWRPLTQHGALRGANVPIMKSAEGCTITTADGSRILDGLAGLWCVNVG
jgi:adenosylmethionine-8-amino-7-oxononanoate aminotransferase